MLTLKRPMLKMQPGTAKRGSTVNPLDKAFLIFRKRMIVWMKFKSC